MLKGRLRWYPGLWWNLPPVKSSLPAWFIWRECRNIPEKKMFVFGHGPDLMKWSSFAQNSPWEEAPHCLCGLCHINTLQQKKLVRGVFAASLHTRPDFACLICLRILPQVEPIGKSSILVCLFSETKLSFSGRVCSLGGFVVTKWNCALTRL